MKSSSHPGISTIATIIIVVVFGGIAAGAYFLFSNESNKAQELRLVDGLSGEPISNTDVRIYSDNGIRCVTTPCPTEGKEWLGKTDNEGVVEIPHNVINVSMAISVTGYKGMDLIKNKTESNGTWTIQLNKEPPVDGYEGGDFTMYRGDGFSFMYPGDAFFEHVEVKEEPQSFYNGQTFGKYPGVAVTSTSTGNFKDDFNNKKPSMRIAVAVAPIENTTCLYRPMGEYEQTAVDVVDVRTNQGQTFKKKIISLGNPSDRDPVTGYPTEGYRGSNAVEACIAVNGKFYHVDILHSDLIDSAHSAVIDQILKSFSFTTKETSTSSRVEKFSWHVETVEDETTPTGHQSTISIDITFKDKTSHRYRLGSFFGGCSELENQKEYDGKQVLGWLSCYALLQGSSYIAYEQNGKFYIENYFDDPSGMTDGDRTVVLEL